MIAAGDEKRWAGRGVPSGRSILTTPLTLNVSLNGTWGWSDVSSVVFVRKRLPGSEYFSRGEFSLNPACQLFVN